MAKQINLQDHYSSYKESLSRDVKLFSGVVEYCQNNGRADEPDSGTYQILLATEAAKIKQAIEEGVTSHYQEAINRHQAQFIDGFFNFLKQKYASDISVASDNVDSLGGLKNFHEFRFANSVMFTEKVIMSPRPQLFDVIDRNKTSGDDRPIFFARECLILSANKKVDPDALVKIGRSKNTFNTTISSYENGNNITLVSIKDLNKEKVVDWTMPIHVESIPYKYRDNSYTMD